MGWQILPLTRASLTEARRRVKRQAKTVRKRGLGNYLLLVATLVARLAKQLAVLLLGHTFATLFDN